MMEIDKNANQPEVWAFLKEEFCKNPDMVRENYTKDLTMEELTNGHSLYVGNCLIIGKCLGAACRHLGIHKKLAISLCEDGKHRIEFNIGTAKCKFDCGKASAFCFAEDKETVTKLFRYFYPDACIFIE